METNLLPQESFVPPGDLWSDTTEALRDAIALNATGNNMRNITIDMVNVTAIDSFAISFLINVAYLVKRDRGNFELVNVRPGIAKTFEGLQLRQFFSFVTPSSRSRA